MLTYNIDGTPDAGLPIDLPDLPNTLTHRWVADSVLDDGAIPLPAAVGDIPLTTPSGAVTPTAGLVDGLRAITYDGSTQNNFASNVNASGGPMSFYAVVKWTADPGAFRAITYRSNFAIGLTDTRVPRFGSTATAGTDLTSAIPVGEWFVIAGSVDRATGSSDGTRRIACSNGESNEQTGLTIPAFAGGLFFGIGFSNVRTAMVMREIGLNVGTAHTVGQLLANIAAIREPYDI